MPTANGKLTPAVILVADRTLSGDYKVLFEGIFATIQTTRVPQFLMRRLLSPPVGVDRQGRARAAPLGLRRLESALLAGGGLTADDVVCTTPEALGSLLGPWVRIVAVSSSDPLGRGMTGTTTASFWGGRVYAPVWLDRMLAAIGRARRKYHFRVVGGGAGAWQWAAFPAEARRQEIDVVFEGYFEDGGVALFDDLLAGRPAPAAVRADDTAVDAIQPIRGPSLMGVVELSRGCGKGCRFCTSAFKKMRPVPGEMILADMRTNAAGGITSIVISSEDLFRYGCNGSEVNFDRLGALLAAMRGVPGVSFMQLDHVNISSILQLTDEQLIEARRLLTYPNDPDFLWVNMGAESASGRLVQANSPGKIDPFRPDDWEDMIREAADRMTRTGYFPVFSVILGLPGETPDDVARTRRLVEYLATRRAAVFPIFHEPVLRDSIDRGERFGLAKMKEDHMDLYRTCYELNFKWVPRLFWDNQRAGGVRWPKRALLQMLGRAEVITWRRTSARIMKGIPNAADAVTENRCAPQAAT